MTVSQSKPVRRVASYVEQRFFPRARRVRICGHQYTFVIPSLWGWFNIPVTADENTWLEGDYSKQLATAIQPGDTVFDIGARFGYHTLLAASNVGQQGRVVSCEPLPEHYSALSSTIRENGLTQRVDHRRVAVTNTGGGVRIGDGATGLGPGIEADSATAITADATTIDSLTTTVGPPDVVKIDIEGAEVLALRGAQQTLTDHQPTLAIEVHQPSAIAEIGGSWPELYGHLSDAGYTHLWRLARGDDGTWNRTKVIDCSPPDHEDRHHLLAYCQKRGGE